MDVLFTCGIGDFFAIESYLSDQERSNIQKIFWATRAREWIKEIVDGTELFPNLKDEIVLFDNWGDGGTTPYAIRDKGELKKIGLDPKGLPDLIDLSGKQIIQQIIRHERFYTGSWFCNVLRDIEIDLPERFVFVHPDSENKSMPERDLTDQDWVALVDFLDRSDIMAVVVNKSTKSPPPHGRILDLTNQTTLPEGVEILKRASGYIGAASCFSVLAAKLGFDHTSMVVKGAFSWLTRTADPTWQFYYYPVQENFIVKDLISLRDIIW